VTGALSKITEAGAVLAGGHTIEDDEPKFGLAVIGIVHPKKFWVNSGAQQGDVLILTKPIGSGVLFNANIKKWVSKQAMDHCIRIISTLNRRAAEVLTDFEVHAVTDVTGFGLAGHSLEMAKGSQVTLEIHMDMIPVMLEALEMYKRGVSTGSNRHNRELVEKRARFERRFPSWHEEILFDPQTSGGLLISLPESQGERLLDALKRGGVETVRLIGKVMEFQNSEHLIFA
jgi:selenide,water dikinase